MGESKKEILFDPENDYRLRDRIKAEERAKRQEEARLAVLTRGHRPNTSPALQRRLGDNLADARGGFRRR